MEVDNSEIKKKLEVAAKEATIKEGILAGPNYDVAVRTFIAGAEWMAKQGVSVSGKVEMDFSDPNDIYARRLTADYYGELGPALMKFNPGDEVIIRIQKKEE